MKYDIKYYVIGFFITTLAFSIVFLPLTGTDIYESGNDTYPTYLFMVLSFITTSYIYNAIENKSKDIRYPLVMLANFGGACLSLSAFSLFILVPLAIFGQDFGLYDLLYGLFIVTLITIMPIFILSKINKTYFTNELVNTLSCWFDYDKYKIINNNINNASNKSADTDSSQNDRTKFLAYSRMNGREREIYKSRKLISDDRLISFLRALLNNNSSFSAEKEHNDMIARSILTSFDNGCELDNIFYTGERYGHSISVKEVADSTYTISINLHINDLFGYGGSWEVSFLGNNVKSITSSVRWIA